MLGEVPWVGTQLLAGWTLVAAGGCLLAWLWPAVVVVVVRRPAVSSDDIAMKYVDSALSRNRRSRRARVRAGGGGFVKNRQLSVDFLVN